MPRRTPIDLAAVRRLALALPGVAEGPSYGTPGFRVRGCFLARMLPDGATLVVKCGDSERDFRLRTDPATFFVTEHYRGYPTVLIRLDRVDLADLRAVLEEAWRRHASAAQLAELDGSRRPTTPKPRARKKTKRAD